MDTQPSLDMHVLQQLDAKEFTRAFINREVRHDKRNFTDARNTTLKSGIFNSPTTYGSSLVGLGDTKMAALVTLLIGKPSVLFPNRGDIVFDIKLGPIASTKYEQQRGKSDELLRLQNILESIIVKSPSLDLEQLCVESGKYAIRLVVTLVCLNDAGNLTDAAAIAAVAALRDVRLPSAEIADGTVYITEERLRSLVFTSLPITTTCFLFDDNILLDPSAAEEEVQDGSITCAFDERGDMCLLLQNAKERSLSIEALREALLLCRQSNEALRAQLGWV